MSPILSLLGVFLLKLQLPAMAALAACPLQGCRLPDGSLTIWGGSLVPAVHPPDLSLLVAMGMLCPVAQELTQSPGCLCDAQTLPPQLAWGVQIGF